MTGPEARIQRDIQKELVKRGVFVFKVHGSDMMPAGLPDLICCVRGWFVGLEVKTPEKRNNVSLKQARMREKIIAADGESYVVWSVEQAMRIIDALIGQADT